MSLLNSKENHPLSSSDAPISWQSMTGVDMVAAFMIKDKYYDSTSEPETPAYKVFAELQTISISSARSVHPVRALGESAVREYTRGARTFAGTLIFAMFSKDPFEEVVRLSSEHEVFGKEAFFIDQIPEFDVVVTSVNEYGTLAKAIIGGITLTNYGTTLSIHDIYTEISYTYVARFYIPMTADIKALDRVRRLMREPNSSSGSTLAESTFLGPNNTSEEDLARRLTAKYSSKTSTGKFIRDYST